MDDLMGFHVGMWDYITFLARREVLVLPSGGAPWKLC